MKEGTGPNGAAMLEVTMDNVNNLPSATVDEIPAGAPVLDVREQDEWDAGHIDGAQHLPLSQLAERTEEVPLDQDVYVICRSGGRSLRATAYLAQYGYDPVNVLGGMGAWADAGKPIVSETGESARVL